VKKILRAFTAFAAVFTLIALSGPAHAGTTETDAELAAEWQYAWDTYKFYDRTPPAPDSGRSQRTASISIVINAPAWRVFDVYSNFNNHIGRNPFLTRVVTHKDWCWGNARYINLTAIEQVPYDGTIVDLKTHAQQRLYRSKLYYEVDSWSAPGVETHQKIVFKALSKGKTEVTEHLTFEADNSLIDFTVTNGVAAHQQIQTALKQAIESGEL
jgi:hypothetical protein